MALRTDEPGVDLRDGNQLINTVVLPKKNPVDRSEDFYEFIQACRRGDLKRCQELVHSGVNINAKDEWDYTPLIAVSSCPDLIQQPRRFSANTRTPN